MAQRRRGFNFSTPATLFPKRLLAILSKNLDEEDDTIGRDWRMFVEKLELSQDDMNILKTQKEKTKVALTLWEHQEGQSECTAYRVLKLLRDMKRLDLVKEMENFLGVSNLPAQEVFSKFHAIDKAARCGDNETLKNFFESKTGQELDEEFKMMPHSPLESAVCYGHYSTVKLFIEAGFSVCRLNVDGLMPRQMADEENTDIIDLLDAETQKDGSDESATVTDSSEKIVEELTNTWEEKKAPGLLPPAKTDGKARQAHLVKNDKQEWPKHVVEVDGKPKKHSEDTILEGPGSDDHSEQWKRYSVICSASYSLEQWIHGMHWCKTNARDPDIIIIDNTRMCTKEELQSLPALVGSYTGMKQLDTERPIAHKEMNRISREVSLYYSRLGRALGYDLQEIDDILSTTSEHTKGNSDKTFAILEAWKRKYGKNATMGKFLEACEEINVKGQVETVLLNH